MFYNIEIVPQRSVEVVGKMVKITGEPPESNKMASNTQNLYRPLPKRLTSEVSFLFDEAADVAIHEVVFDVVGGRESSSFMLLYF